MADNNPANIKKYANERQGILPGPTAVSGLAVGLLALLSVKFCVDFLGIPLLLWQKTVLFSITAVALTFPFKLPRWWIVIFILFPAAFMLLSGQSFPIWIYPTLFVILLLVNWNVLVDRVPLYLTNSKTVDALSLLIDAEERKHGAPLNFYDLGCGVGSVLIPLAKLYPEHLFIGVETAPMNWLIGIIWAKAKRTPNLKIKRQSIWTTDISDGQIIYAFLSPQPMDELLEKCKAELSNKAILISNSFDSNKYPAEEMIPVNDSRQTRLLFWQF